MSPWASWIIEAIPESFFRQVAERALSGAAMAARQALRTPADDPTHAHRLGSARYHERNLMLRESALATPGLGLVYRTYKSHCFPVALAPPFLISHAKIGHWGEPPEEKDYKLELAARNPGVGQQLGLFAEDEQPPDCLALIVLQYGALQHGPPAGSAPAAAPAATDTAAPLARVGLGVPTRDLSGWAWLVALEDLFGSYRDRVPPPPDRARPQLKRQGPLGSESEDRQQARQGRGPRPPDDG